MPKSTYSFAFEFKILTSASKLADRLAARDQGRSFLIVLDERGWTRQFHLECPAGDSRWSETIKALRDAGASYFFYDPLDTEYTYVDWHRVERRTMERLIDQPFSEYDFGKLQDVGLDPPCTFPATWSVMF